MKLLIWKLRYAYYMWKRSDCDFKWCFKYAEVALIEEFEECMDLGPEFSASEDMSCWSD